MYVKEFLVINTSACETLSGGCSFCSFLEEISSEASERQVYEVLCFLLKAARAISGTEAE